VSSVAGAVSVNVGSIYTGTRQFYIFGFLGNLMEEFW